jgi:hypothetical protein
VGISEDLVVQRKDRSNDSHTSVPDWLGVSLSHSFAVLLLVWDKSSQKLAGLYRAIQIASYFKFLQSAKMHRQPGSPGSGSASTSSAFRRIPPVPAQAPASVPPPSRKRTAPKAVSFPAWHKHWNRYNTLVSDRFAGDDELAKACGMSNYGTAAVTDFLKDFSDDEVAFLILDRQEPR